MLVHNPFPQHRSIPHGVSRLRAAEVEVRDHRFEGVEVGGRDSRRAAEMRGRDPVVVLPYVHRSDVEEGWIGSTRPAIGLPAMEEAEPRVLQVPGHEDVENGSRDPQALPPHDVAARNVANWDRLRDAATPGIASRLRRGLRRGHPKRRGGPRSTKGVVLRLSREVQSRRRRRDPAKPPV